MILPFPTKAISMSTSNTSKESLAESRAATAIAIAPHDTIDLREQVRVLAEDVKELARLSKDAIGNKLNAAKDATQHALESGRDKALEYRDMIAEKAQKGPIKALLIATGIGAILGVIIGRR
jgi:ElaB/YqjD/DUF883 family membrane-anchored ribosome-binding protein